MNKMSNIKNKAAEETVIVNVYIKQKFKKKSENKE